jgi:transposase InsO family protein
MDIHKNARTTPRSRVEIVRRVLELGQRPTQVAAGMGISVRTVRKWVARYQHDREAGLAERSCRPRRQPTATPRRLVRWVLHLRRQRWPGVDIAARLRLSPATVARLLRRHGLARLRALESPRPVRRYQRRRPGSLLHVDTKKLGRIGRIGHRISGDRRARVRGIGWEHVHVAIDDATRLAYVEVLRAEDGPTCAAFLWRALAWFRRLGVRVRQLMTDNAWAYRAAAYAAVCRGQRLRHLRTRPYTPQTNGKAERFIQSLLREWAYRRPYRSSARRHTALAPWLHFYNWHRRHASLHGRPPISRLVTGDNLLRLHT